MPHRWTLAGLVVSTLASAQVDGGTHAVPMELRRNMPFVEVRVNGRGPYVFGLDTGTGTEALATAHGPAGDGRRRSVTGTLSSPMEPEARLRRSSR